MIQEWQHNGALLTVEVFPFYAEVLSVRDEDDAELPPIIFATPQEELNAYAELAWADEQGK